MNAKRRKTGDPNYITAPGSSGEGSNDVVKIPIRVLRVAPVKADANELIKAYFERYGEINSVKIQQDAQTNTHFALIEFKTVEEATAVLSSKEIFIEVKAAEPWHQPDHILNALNDHCLQAILAQLNQSDLLNTVNVCVKFNEQTRAVFSSKYKKLRLTDGSFENMKNVLQTFGTLIQSVDIHAQSFTDCFMYSDFAMKSECEIKLLLMIARYCTSTLKELILRDFGLKNDDLPNDMNFVPAFNKLERLSFINCDFRMFDLFAVCAELKELRFERCHQLSDDVTTISQMEHLNVLEFCDIFGMTDEYMMELARGLGEHLQKLELNGSTGHELTIIGLKKMLPFAKKLSLLSLKSTGITVDEDDYQTLLKTVRKRPEKIQLVIELIGEGGQVKVPETILRKNRDIFYIDEKIDVDSGFDFDSRRPAAYKAIGPPEAD